MAYRDWANDVPEGEPWQPNKTRSPVQEDPEDDYDTDDHLTQMEESVQCCAGRCSLWAPSVPRKARIVSILVCVFWVCLIPVFVVCFPKFNGATKTNFDAPKGSRSEAAGNAQKRYFPATQNNGSLVFYVERGDGSPLASKGQDTAANCKSYPAVCQFSRKLAADVMEKAKSTYPKLEPNGVWGYYVDGTPQADQLLSNDTSGTMILIQLGNTADNQDDCNNLIKWLRDYPTTNLSQNSSSYWAGITGPDALNLDAQEGTMSNTEGVEKYTFPIAFLVLACFVRSARMMVIPLLTIAMCLGTTFSICYGVAQGLDIVTIAPALMMAATLAFNIDYNLFLLTRFRDNSSTRTITLRGPDELEQCCELADSNSGVIVRRAPLSSAVYAVGVRKGWELRKVHGEAVETVEELRSIVQRHAARNDAIDHGVPAPSAVELEFGMPLWKNVWESVVVHTASETVLLSGTLVTIAFFAMALIPLNALYGLGVCGGVAVFVCVIVNCTLTPSLLLIFGDFFAGPWCTEGVSAWWAGCRGLRSGGGDDADSLLGDVDRRRELRKSCWYRLSELIQRCPVVPILLVIGIGTPLWIKFPKNIEAKKINADPFEFAPRDSGSVKTWRRVARRFDEGKLQAYTFIMVNNSVQWQSDSSAQPAAGGADAAPGEEPAAVVDGVYSATGYMKAQDMIERIHNATGIQLHTFLGPIIVPLAVSDNPMLSPFCADLTKDAPKTNVTLPIPGFPPIPNTAIPVTCSPTIGDEYIMLDFKKVNRSMGPVYADTVFDTIANLLAQETPQELCAALCRMVNKPSSIVCSPTCPELLTQFGVTALFDMYRAILGGQISSPAAAMTIQCFTPFQPTGLQAMEWMDDVTPALDAFARDNTDLTPHLTGGNAIFHDFNKTVNEKMPRMIGILLAVVFVIVCVVFRSVAIGLVMAITIVYSVGTAYGLAYYVYQTSGFNWLFTYLPDFHNQGLNWAVVPMTFAITVALAMDYDVFILTRIFELRRSGLSTEDSVKEAMYGVAGTIGGAGCIMAIAFGALMLTSVVALNQFGVLLTVSILIDTFLMATVVVPASLFLFGRWSWFPGPLHRHDADPVDEDAE